VAFDVDRGRLPPFAHGSSRWRGDGGPRGRHLLRISAARRRILIAGPGGDDADRDRIRLPSQRGSPPH
jgi:hypothetical protein